MFESKIKIKIKEQGLFGEVYFNFQISPFPEYIEIFIPREYKKEKDYLKILIPIEKRSGLQIFKTTYIRERKEERYNILKNLI